MIYILCNTWRIVITAYITALQCLRTLLPPKGRGGMSFGRLKYIIYIKILFLSNNFCGKQILLFQWLKCCYDTVLPWPTSVLTKLFTSNQPLHWHSCSSQHNRCPNTAVHLNTTAALTLMFPSTHFCPDTAVHLNTTSALTQLFMSTQPLP